MKKIKITTLIFASVVAAKAAAVAPLPMGWYLEVNGGGSKITDVSYVSGSSITTSGIGWNANGGYKFMPFFAAEAGYIQYASTSSKLAGNKVATATYYSYEGAAKALLPIGDTGAEFFAKLGIAHLHSKVKSTQFARNNGIPVSTGTNNVNGLFFGLGADYSFIPNAAANIQWQRAKGNSKTGTLNLYSVGLSYLFG
ncbi:MAG TPA: outer membrane beta-barrel protein [Gammaproteobacteria bacterium]|nr:outer membrane beta-barrel protein [Gammaproteobacteria bacterium]